MIILLMACLSQKTNLAGVIDYANGDRCAVELNTGELIYVKSNMCSRVKEGDTILFYVRRQ